MYLLPGLTLNWYVEVCILEVYGGNPPPAWREILIVSVSILNFSVFRNWFRVLRSPPVIGFVDQKKPVVKLFECDQFYCIFDHKLMQCLYQVPVPQGIYIANYDGR